MFFDFTIIENSTEVKLKSLKYVFRRKLFQMSRVIIPQQIIIRPDTANCASSVVEVSFSRACCGLGPVMSRWCSICSDTFIELSVCSWCPRREPRASSRVTDQQYHSRYEDICPPTLSVGRGARSLHKSLNLLSFLLISSCDRCMFGFWTFWKHELRISGTSRLTGDQVDVVQWSSAPDGFQTHCSST